MDVSIWTLTLEESLAESLDTLITFLPKVVGAVVLIAVGMIVGRLVAAGTGRLLALVGTDRLSAGVGISGLLHRAGVTKDASALLGSLAYWVVLLLFVITAIQTLGLAALSESLAAAVSYLPNLALAAVIALVGLAAANFARDSVTDACRAAGLPHGAVAGRSIYGVIVLLVAIMVVAELGVDTALLDTVVILLVSGAMGAVALSVGLGARTMIANVLAAYSVKAVLTVGQQVRVGALQGRVTALTPTSVVLEADGKRVVVPASYFGDTVSVAGTADAGS